MTRDEANDKLLELTSSGCTPDFIRDFIDSAVALGMLRLDEPKYTFEDLCRNLEVGPQTLRHILHTHKLKIVEDKE